MLRNLARFLCAAALAGSALAVLAAGPLTSGAAVSILPSFTLDISAYLLSLAV